MNKKVIALSVVCTMIFSGCFEKKPLIDSEKVGAVALEYMNSKYNQDFELISCKPSKDFGIENQESYANAKVSLKDDEYSVKLTLSEDNKSEWEVYWDDYMNTVADPFFRENMDSIIQNVLDVKEFTSGLCTVSGGYSDKFPVLNENDTLKEIADSNAIALIYDVYMPESSHYEGVDEDVKNALDPYFPHSLVYINVYIYSNDVYGSVKEKTGKYYNEKELFSYNVEIKNKMEDFK